MTSNYIDATGLVLQSLADIVAELTAGFKAIYGADINTDPNSPDGQMIALFAQAKIDILDLISQVYGSFSPTSAIGVVLDSRAALSGITRKGATKTTVNVTLNLDRQVILPGSDGAATPFTVADGAGNKFYLTTGLTGATGANTELFTAAVAGNTQVTVGGISNIVTVTLGVTGASNAAGAITQGLDEETDASFRFRRALSVAIPSTGYLDGLTAALLAIGTSSLTGATGATGVTGPTGSSGATGASSSVAYALVHENVTGSTDATNTPAHSIWAIVDGGAATDIASVIYLKRNGGCGMTGSTSVNITQVNGEIVPIKYSYCQYVNLYVALTVTSLNSAYSPDTTAIKNAIVAGIQYGINQSADFSQISALVKNTFPYCVINSGFVGLTGATGASYLAPTTIDKRFILATSRIAVTAV